MFQATESREDTKKFNYYNFSHEVNNRYTLAEYVWIDGSHQTRSKTKVYEKPINCLEDLEWWTYDGSSTMQAVTNDSEIFLKPVAIFMDPFREQPHLLVLCETYLSDMITPARYNFRFMANKLMDETKDHKPWFGVEQEYFLMKRTGTYQSQPLGFPEEGQPQPQGPYYCSVGDGKAFGRSLVEAHLRCCLNAGIKIHGVNAEVAPGQWEYQVGICQGIELGDHLWMARYILNRLGEEFGCAVTLEPKPLTGDWNGSGAHTNFSTEETRQEGGYELLKSKYIPALEKTHKQVLQAYGIGNQARLTGHHETSSFDKFSWGDGNRGGSCRIPVYTKSNGKGYIEDRRPAANMDPYMVSSMIVDSTLLKGRYCEQLLDIQSLSEKDFLPQQKN